jgi:hypothetical protein
MRLTPDEPKPRLTIDQLLSLAAEWAGRAGDSLSADMCDVKVRACLDIAEIKLRQEQIKLVNRANELNEKLLDGNNASRVIAGKQLAANEKANALAEELLASNRQASEQSEKNAKLMNDATDQLAISTKSLKWATWALVAFTAVQALIASVALYVSMHPSN